MFDVPAVVVNKARAVGADAWLDHLPRLVQQLRLDWSIEVGAPYMDGTEAYVTRVTTSDGTTAVLKLMIPRDDDAVRNEVSVLRRVEGRGCVRLLRDDVDRGAMLLERLGPSMAELGLPLHRRVGALCDAASAMWISPDGLDLPSGADKATVSSARIEQRWAELGRPCSRRAVDHALRCADRRLAAHDDARSVLVHGDVHQWNALRHADGFRLVDPDGLIAEAEYDLGVLMREDPLALIADGDPGRRARWLAGRTGLSVGAIEDWGTVERVSTGLLATQIGLEPIGRHMLDAAEHVARFA